jgi:hypothetical protein
MALSLMIPDSLGVSHLFDFLKQGRNRQKRRQVMRIAIFTALIIMLITPSAFAKIEHDGKLPNRAYGARVLSVGYRYYWKTNSTQIRVHVRYQNTYSYIYFSGEHLAMGASMLGLVGKKINLATGEGGDLFIIGYASSKYK